MLLQGATKMHGLDHIVADLLAQALDDTDADDDPVVALSAQRAAVLDHISTARNWPRRSHQLKTVSAGIVDHRRRRYGVLCNGAAGGRLRIVSPQPEAARNVLLKVSMTIGSIAILSLRAKLPLPELPGGSDEVLVYMPQSLAPGRMQDLLLELLSGLLYLRKTAAELPLCAVQGFREIRQL
jgi:hypothetical protein